MINIVRKARIIDNVCNIKEKLNIYIEFVRCAYEFITIEKDDSLKFVVLTSVKFALFDEEDKRKREMMKIDA